LTSTLARHTPHNHKTNIPNIYPFIPQRSSPIKTPKNSSHLSKGEWSYLLLKKQKREEKKEKKEFHSPSLNELQNKELK